MKNRQFVKMLAMESRCKIEMLHDLSSDRMDIQSESVRVLVMIQKIIDIIDRE